MGEELMMEAWGLLKNEEEGGLFPLPTFPLIIKLLPTNFSGHSTLSSTHLQFSQASYSNKSLLIHHFASRWILSALRHKELELLGAHRDAT